MLMQGHATGVTDESEFEGGSKGTIMSEIKPILPYRDWVYENLYFFKPPLKEIECNQSYCHTKLIKLGLKNINFIFCYAQYL